MTNKPKRKKKTKSLDNILSDAEKFLNGKELSETGKEDFMRVLKRSVKPNKSGLQSN